MFIRTSGITNPSAANQQAGYVGPRAPLTRGVLVGGGVVRHLAVFVFRVLKDPARPRLVAGGHIFGTGLGLAPPWAHKNGAALAQPRRCQQ